jgi:hypothetical protein
MASRTDSAAKALGLSPRSVRRLVVRYRASAQTTSLLPYQGGPRKDLRRLGADRERHSPCTPHAAPSPALYAPAASAWYRRQIA